MECFFAVIKNILCEIWNILYQVFSDAEVLEAYVNVASSILMGVIAIIGINYLKPLKDKTVTATFTFWAQLRVRLISIKKWLDQDCGLLDNLYSPSAKKDISELTPQNTRIQEFKKIVQSTIKYIEDADDQMPAYEGWSDDYSALIGYLQDMIVYDICNHDDFFKFNKKITDNDREKYKNEICDTIDRVCDGIKKKQSEIEKKLCKK